MKKACEIFWAQGFVSSGVRSVERKSGINQFAMQTEFGGKEGLYLAAINFYAGAAIEHALQPMKSGGVAAIANFFHGLVSDGSPTSSKWGCLIVNAGIENAERESAKVAAACRAYWLTLEKHFAMALRWSVRAGEISKATEVKKCAKSLVIAVMGIHAMNRTERSNRAGAPLVQMIQQQIRSWQV